MDKQTSPEAVSRAPGWTLSGKCGLLAWEWCWLLFASWTPKPLNRWRLLLLKAFGATIRGKPFVHQQAHIQIPWKIELQDRSCIGSRAVLYSLDRITVGAHTIIAQEAYICTGTHKRENEVFPLYTAPIHIGSRCFIGARAFILPGITVGDESTLGACSLLSRNIPDGEIWAGNPAQPIAIRTRDP